MNEQMLALITGSHHVSTSTRGKALGLLNVGTNYKRGRAKFEETHAEEQPASRSQVHMSRDLTVSSSMLTNSSMLVGGSTKRPLPNADKDRRK